MCQIEGHPLELYFQQNPYQDMMSVGCYDFSKGIWLVGPELKPKDYDPYSQFYSKDMEYVKDVIKDIRNIILECYETAIVIQNSQNGKFREEEYASLREKLKVGVNVFEKAKQCRKAFSSPTSVEDALAKRKSMKWKIADSSFKLMDKFGYLGILKSFQKIADNLDGDMDLVADGVIRSVKNRIDVNETIDESVGKIGALIMIASLLALPGFVTVDAIASGLRKIRSGNFSIENPQV